MRRTSLAQFALSASMLALLGGCASGRSPSLEIRSVGQSQMSPDTGNIVDRGKELLSRGQNADAISAFRGALRTEGNQAEAYNGMAIAYDRIGRADLARRYFELAVAEQPTADRYRNNLARFFNRSGQPELAQGLLNPPAVAKAPADAIEAPMAQIAISTELKADDAADGTDVAIAAEQFDALEAIIADFRSRPGIGDDAIGSPAKLAGTLPAPVTANMIQPAVQRVPLPVAIAAKTFSAPKRPIPPTDTPEARREWIAPLSRSERRSGQTNGANIERISLGEVQLFTARQIHASHRQFDIDDLASELELWAHSERRKQPAPPHSRLNSKLAILNAVERATIYEAILESENMIEKAEPPASRFAYVFFQGLSDDGDNGSV